MVEKEDDKGKHPIVIDNGNSYIKAGFGGEEGPRLNSQQMLVILKILMVIIIIILELMQKKR